MWRGHYLLTTLGTKNNPLQHLISQVLKGLSYISLILYFMD